MKKIAHRIYESMLSYETRLWLLKQRKRGHFERKRNVVNPSDKGDFSLKPFDEHHCIFVHITKTAGTAVAKSLFGYLPYHYTAIDYRVIYGKRDFDDYYKFGFVRNPWDRLFSAWRYLRAGGWNDEDAAWYKEHLAGYETFAEFVRGWVNEQNIGAHKHFWPQHRFVCDTHHQLMIDDVFYFETLDADFASACERLDIDAHLEPHNTNPGDDYRDVYDEEMRRIVADVYRLDIELFGYRFDGIERRWTRDA